jgi:adenosylcobyric acid synthase
MRARAIMVLGTGSHVGKSLITAALCRIFARRGYRVAPFKAQNMSLNSAVTIEGLEIGRAQALQAEAAGVPASVHMNPILLKPAGNMTSQVVVRGRIWGTLGASDYHLRRVDELWPIVCESYEHLAAQHDLIILEGAGSPAEINLKQHDIVNMRMAELADAACLLVGDIDRGGVFASLFGTIELLEPQEQARIRGFIINKFRGDITLLTPGIKMIEDRLRKPCLGIIPWLSDLTLDEEDSLGLPPDSSNPPVITGDPSRPLHVAVVAFPSFSNFTDFDALHSETSVVLTFARSPEQLRAADVIILPGTKQTVDDLQWLRNQQLDTAILDPTALIVGICGGMQMLGRRIRDPHGIERTGDTHGLDLLPIETTMKPAKITRINSGTCLPESLFGQPVPPLSLSGYEIHIGETSYLKGASPFAKLDDATHLDGCISSDTRVFGTYLHGIFDDDCFRHAFITAARAHHHLTPAVTLEDWKHKRGAALNRLTDAVEQALDLPVLLSWATPVTS